MSTQAEELAEEAGAPRRRPADVRGIGLRKTYGEVVAVDGVDLEIQQGEFFTMLGPSGSGKTTTLRLIAGFERPDSGRLELGGVDVTDVPPYARDVNTVFQDYALFPHMSVAQNVEYGLRVKGVEKRERRKRVEEALEMVRLASYGGRKPAQLSGGQRQRVALARAIVNRPRVLLLDEPLGALDLKLRQEMQIELKRIQQEVGITFVVIYNNVIARLRRSSRSIEEASADLGADTWQTFRYVTFPQLRTALLAGGLLAFALSFDEVIVTTFTAGPQQTLPLWILQNLSRPNQLPVVNVVALLVVLLSAIPVYVAQKLTQESGVLGHR